MSLKIYVDTASIEEIEALVRDPLIQGVTCNPTIMRKCGVVNYRDFALAAIGMLGDKPISLEVVADEPDAMKDQARKIASWGKNIYVKVPIVNSRGESTEDVIHDLTHFGVKVNVTAVMTAKQVDRIYNALTTTPAIVSVFCGRISDTGRDPFRTMVKCAYILERRPNVELLWASVRSVRDVYVAEDAGAHIITLAPELLAKLALKDKDLDEYSRETAAQFYNDGKEAGYSI